MSASTCPDRQENREEFNFAVPYAIIDYQGHENWAHQGRETLVGMAPEHREAAMGAGVGRRQDLAEGVYHRPRHLRQRWVG